MTNSPEYPPAPVPMTGSHQSGARLASIFLTADQIRERVQELGDEISRDYEGNNLLLISILKGAVVFMADLARAITLDVEMDYLAISSYLKEHEDTANKGVRFLKDLDQPIKDRDVLVVQDIIDTGLTLHFILRSLDLRGPRSLEVCTLLDRPHQRLVDVNARYVGFEVPDEFVVGYGFDFRQYFRNIPHITHIEIDDSDPLFK